MKILDESKAIRIKIMDFLSRREHSSKEIYQKMSRRVESKDMLAEEINRLISDGLISDERFAESYLQSRKNRGFGPLRIRNELAQRGVKESIFYFIQSEIDWSEYAFNALEKKINRKKPDDMKAILKLKNFLNYRGFEFQDIDKAFSRLDEENR